MTRRAGMVASFSTGTSVGKRRGQVRGVRASRLGKQEDSRACRAGRGLLLMGHHVWAQLRGPIPGGGESSGAHQPHVEKQLYKQGPRLGLGGGGTCT